MDRKEKILEYLKSGGYVPLKLDELAAVLCVPEEDMTEFSNILHELMSEGRIILSKKKRYTVSDKKIVSGTISCNAYGCYGFLKPDDENEEEIFISGEKLGGALHGDRVLAEIDPENPLSGKREGHIFKILERGIKRLTCVISKEKKNVFEAKPDNRRIYRKILIRKADMGDSVIGIGFWLRF